MKGCRQIIKTYPASFVIGSLKEIATSAYNRPKQVARLERSPSQIQIADFAVTYADQTEGDYQLLVDAIESGRVIAETEI